MSVTAAIERIVRLRLGRVRPLWLLTLVTVLLGCAPGAGRDYVVLYTSQDQFYAEPILDEFTRETGLAVRTVFDTEAAKTVGLANRLRAEQKHPGCDLFWSNEEMQMRRLLAEGVVLSEGWRSAGFRTRRIVINTNLVRSSDAPRGLLELTNAFWRGKIALAYPLFGTTSAHFEALRQHWGDAVWQAWCRGLVQNGAKVVDGNSLVVRLVATAEAWIGLTDSDDIAAGLKQSWPIAPLPPGPETLVIPGTIGFVARGPRPGLAARLAEYLARPETLQRLVAAGALEGAGSGPQDALLPASWTPDSVEATEFLADLFIRS